VIECMVSEGIEVWGGVVWCEKVFLKEYAYTKVSGEKMKAMEARHVGIQREREIEGGKRGKGGDSSVQIGVMPLLLTCRGLGNKK